MGIVLRLCCAVGAMALFDTVAWAQGQAPELAPPGSSSGAPAPSAPVPVLPGQTAPVGPEPGGTTATYGDWTLRCENAPAAAGSRRVCEVAQTLQAQGQQAPIAQVAFGRLDASPGLHFVAALPVNVAFPSSVKVGVEDKDAHSLELAWKRCLPGACFADALASGDIVAGWRTAVSAGRLAFTSAAGRDVVLPLSFRGLAQALDALGQQP